MKTTSQKNWGWIGLAGCFVIWVCAAAAAPAGPVEILFGGRLAPAAGPAVCGLAVVAGDSGPQVAWMEGFGWVAAVGAGEEAAIGIPVGGGVSIQVAAREGEAEVVLSMGDRTERRILKAAAGGRRVFETIRVEGPGSGGVARVTVRGRSGEAAVQCRALESGPAGARAWFGFAALPSPAPGPKAPPLMPALRPALERVMVEWDWRMQDGIGTARRPARWVDAIGETLRRGDGLEAELSRAGVVTGEEAARWEGLWREWRGMAASAAGEGWQSAETVEEHWEDLWRRAHEARRARMFRRPEATGPVVFVKQVPSCFSHQLTQYYGSAARPGGGLFVLDNPGESMRCRPLAGSMAAGSWQHPEVSWDGRRILFAYCPVETAPKDRETCLDRFYHLYETTPEGGAVRQLTSGPHDDFSPRELPDGRLVFISTRRGGFHRCGRGPCPTYTLAMAEADGSNPRPVSFHETHEWDPCVLNDGRIIYTRWDYVDRHAVHYQQLWTVRPDGSDPRAFYGNNTLNPVGVWEARPVPGSTRVMATAGAHHAMTAGSVILLDTARGVDGLAPVRRLTPDALFPESEAPVSDGRKGAWHAPAGVAAAPAQPVEAARWPGHCYRSPYPLSETVFWAAYSYDPLLGEPVANPPNQFGLYLVDAFGNKELVHRDLSVSSVWPVAMRARPRAPAVSPPRPAELGKEGVFFVENVREAWPQLPTNAVKRLRVVQVLPKSTPHANDPAVGLANASPGKQVLGSVPVEADGSAFFRAPAGVALAFQALDERGQAVQVMRSVTYLQPGETAACVGCHEHRATAPGARGTLAQMRAPSVIEPGPEGSCPLSYPRLVQPVLDRHCVRCHDVPGAVGKVVLTGRPEGRYTVSYNALAPRVRFAEWTGAADFQARNSEPGTQPGFFGARASSLTKYLLPGHEKVELSGAEFERLAMWMDANALFYGTFDPAGQARQQRGERIEGPAAE